MFDLPNPHAWTRRVKRLMFLAMDTLLVPISLYLALMLRYGTATPTAVGLWPLFVLMTGLGSVYMVLFRLPWIKLNAFEDRAIAKIGMVAVTLSISAMVLSYLLALPAPRSVPLLLGVLFFFCAILARIGALAVLTGLWPVDAKRERVMIYGAGQAGIQLASALRQSHEANPVIFVDDNPNLQGLIIAGIRVHAPQNLTRLIDQNAVERVLLAMPSVPLAQQRRLLTQLEVLNVPVQVLPSYVDMMAGRGGGGDLVRLVSPDALLGRDAVRLDTPEIAKAYAGRVVLVTGAGGSIGAELSRQVLRCKPDRVVLFDHSEYNLYAVLQEITPLAAEAGIAVVARLGSVLDKQALAALMHEQGVEIVLHAAAYKHVPLVEDNVLAGMRNNVLGTQVVAEAAAQAAVERFILISTDKAVRPTNVMGATKRMAELVVQDLQSRHPGTKFSMVRFGNVLGSSGSVLPLFQKQIAAGGPVTVTHPDVTRFFMTIPEAARLVLLAGAYAQGRDLFVLDMGKPQKILDIARRMVALSGREVRDPETGQGDIDIVITGLRPGEKLYEELLIDAANLVATPHPKILRAEEGSLSELEVARMLRSVQVALQERDSGPLCAALKSWVEGYGPQPPEAKRS